jgi:hypothetical protein
MSNRLSSAAAELASILAEPLLCLPPGPVDSVASELREMSSPAARAVWGDDRWMAVVGWVLRRVPECDPVLPAIHAVRRAPMLNEDPHSTNCLARYVLTAARRCVVDRPYARSARLEWEPVAEAMVRPLDAVSLAQEAGELLRATGVVVSGAAWGAISEHVDIAVDWLDGFAANTTHRGEALVVAARDSAAMTSGSRLRHHVSGPAARPLVALLLGGDQWGRQGRQECGTEVSLVLWALAARRARLCGEADPVPPIPVVRACATAAKLVDRALAPTEVPAGPELAPSVAA